MGTSKHALLLAMAVAAGSPFMLGSSMILPERPRLPPKVVVGSGKSGGKRATNRRTGVAAAKRRAAKRKRR